jgi:hypothetical protein
MNNMYFTKEHLTYLTLYLRTRISVGNEDRLVGPYQSMSRNSKFYIPKCSQWFVEYETIFHFNPNGRIIKKSKMASKMAAKIRKNINYHYLAIF